jgi:hypothetical protein
MVKTSVELRLRYPYEEFADHLKAMKTVRQWEYTSRFGHLGRAQTSLANSARIVEYFSDSYQNQKEAVHKAEVFLSIYDYIGRHAALFSRKGLMEEADDGLFSVEPALLRAVHLLFTAADQPTGIIPKKVITLAKAFQEIVQA